MNLEFLKENISRILSEGRLPDAENIKLLTDEEIENIISQQEERNIPADLKEHYFVFLRKCLKSINESFKSTYSLCTTASTKTENFILDNIFERINLIAYVSDKIKNEDENLHALLLELPIRNLLKFDYSSITMGNILAILSKTIMISMVRVIIWLILAKSLRMFFFFIRNSRRFKQSV